MEDAYFGMGDVRPSSSKATSSDPAPPATANASVSVEGGSGGGEEPKPSVPHPPPEPSSEGTRGVVDPAYDSVRNPMVVAALAAASSGSGSGSGPQSSGGDGHAGEDDPTAGGAPAAQTSAAGSGGGSSGGGGIDPPPSSNNPADDANEELAHLLQTRRISQSDVISLQRIVRENAALKEKITKLKSLLGRSAKAQKETKAELDVAKVRLDEAHRETERLRRKVESLAARPTHMDLLADFETNFDKALLSIGNSAAAAVGEQKSGEDSHGGGGGAVGVSQAASAGDGAGLLDPASAAVADGAAGAVVGVGGSEEVVSSMLLTELSEAKSRIAHLESLNSALLHRASKLERSNESLSDERDGAVSRLTNLQLELRMAKMETENAARAVREKESSLAEMQMEIDLVTKSAMDANVRAAEGMEAAKVVSADRAYVEELEAKVTALQEWALASAESKRLANERCRFLEEKMRELTEPEDGDESRGLLASVVGTDSNLDNGSDGGAIGGGGGRAPPHERRLWTRQSTLVVGAGLVGGRVVDLGRDVQIHANESVVLRWKFDLTPAEVDILFSIVRGRWEHNSVVKLREADALFRDRHVNGGGAGEVSGAFTVQGACTLVWNNSKSWVRPKTIKYTVEAYAVM